MSLRKQKRLFTHNLLIFNDKIKFISIIEIYEKCDDLYNIKLLH